MLFRSKAQIALPLHRCIAELDGCGHEQQEIDQPRQFQLTTPNAHIEILVEGRTERDELQFRVVAEETLRSLVKALGDMVEGIWRAISGLPQLLYSGYQRESMGDKMRVAPSKNLLALLLTKTEPAKTPSRQVSSHVMPVMSN